MLSDKIEEATKQSPFLVKDELLNKRVQEMVCQIAGNYCSDIRVYILRNPNFNAAMFPNGMMHIWTGLLLRVENEAQLAAVIGHEIAHFLKSHSIKQQKSAKSKTSAVAWVSLISSAAEAGYVGDIFSLGVLASVMSYSRSHESEADAFGIKLMADAGYDPRQASLVWDYIERENEHSENPRKRSVFLASHPSPKNRKKTLENLAAALPTKTYLSGDKNYHLLLEEHYPELITAELEKRLYSHNEFLLQHLKSRKIDSIPLDYYWGIFYKNRGGDGDRQLAMKHFQKAIDKGNAPPEAYRELGYISLKDKKMSSAKKFFNQYLELLSDAPDKEMIEFYLNMDG